MQKDQLYMLGFSEKEATVYLMLNKMGPSVASTLARLTNIKRTTVYNILNSLVGKNLISSFQKDSYTYFVVDDVNKLLHYEKEKVNIAKLLIPQLEEEHGKSQGVKVIHYKGVEGYRAMYENILKTCPKEFCAWINFEFFYAVLDMEREEQWTRDRIAKNIYVRSLVQDTPIGRTLLDGDKEFFRETRLVPKEYSFGTACFLYDNEVIFFNSKDEIAGIHICDPEIYEMQKQIFELSWKLFKGNK